MFQHSPVTERRCTRAIASKNYTYRGNALTQLYKDREAQCAGPNGLACFAMHGRIFYYELCIELFKADKDRHSIRESNKNSN
jgi:hypothetical protein